MRRKRKDRRVLIQVLATTEDDYGEPVDGWTDVRKESAHYHPGSGAERRIASQEQASLGATFTLWANDLTKSIEPQSHRLSFDGGTWDIESAVAVDRGREIELVAIRRVLSAES